MPKFHFFTARLCLLGIALSGCSNPSADERISRLGPIHGRSNTTYMVSSSNGEVDIDGVADIARSIGRYRRLNLSEGEKVRKLAQQKFDGFVIQELRNLQPEYESRKREIQRKSRDLSDESPSKADIIKQEEETKLRELEKDIREQAIIAVKRRYGSQIAVPLRTRDNKPAVAISKIRGDQVQAPTEALELDRKPGSIIQHKGKTTPVTNREIKIP